ncbi:MAG TPA: molybdopterin-dependent oxidoreductase [Actinomycetota bacterium]
MKLDVKPGARVQRRTDDLPILHLEREIPAAGWELAVDGAVAEPASWSLDAIRAMAPERRVWDLHCVWGWTRLGLAWEGVPAARVLDFAHPLPEARFVMVTAAGNGYTSCFPLNRARRSLLAWRVDGAALTPEHGGPLRLVPPPTKWGYKGVKWVSRLTLIEEFRPGFWESLIGDPHGDIPRDLLDHLDESILDERHDDD